MDGLKKVLDGITYVLFHLVSGAYMASFIVIPIICIIMDYSFRTFFLLGCGAFVVAYVSVGVTLEVRRLLLKD